MVKAMEKAGFDIQSAENVSIHYSITIKKWHDNWLKSRDAVLIPVRRALQFRL